MYQHTPVPRVVSSDASERTQRRRRDDLVERRERLSGGAEDMALQLGLEVRALTKEDRQKLLADAGVKLEIDATQSLAIKAELAIPWYRLRILRT